MSRSKLKLTSLIQGGTLILYLALSLVGIIIYIAIFIPPVGSRNIYLDEGCVRIADGGISPSEGLAKIGYPLRERDRIQLLNDLTVGANLYQVHRAKTINIIDFGKNSIVKTSAITLRELLEQDPTIFNLSELDRLEPQPNTRLTDGMTVNITRVTTQDEIVIEPVQPWYELQPDENLPRGKVQTIAQGQPGIKEVKYRKFFKNGNLTLTKKIDEKVTKPPVPGVKHIGSRVLVMSRSGYRGKRMLEMEATAYDPGPKSTGKWCDGKTAIGLKAEYGIAAVDPKVIPLRTKLFVEGYGYAIAGDVGGAIKGLRIDLLFDSRKEALKFGRRKVKVYILDE